MKINRKNKTFILAAVLVLAAVLRLLNLGTNPPHLTPDEAALGYNAYSILKTGRDEHGVLFPVVLKSFGDYKPGLYSYLSIPVIGVLGLNEISVRLVGAISGIILVGLVYLISRRLWKDEGRALAASLVAAVNPWMVLFSRGAWEVNLALCLALAGVYLFLVALEKERALLLSAVCFGGSLLAYQGAKLASGIVVIVLAGVYWKELRRISWRVTTLSVMLGILVSLPIVYSVLRGEAGRLKVFSIFSYPREEYYIGPLLKEAEVERGSLIYRIFYPESVGFARGILGRWFNHFSGIFLLFEGDWQNVRHSYPNYGMLLWGDVIFLLAGGGYMMGGRRTKAKMFVGLWLVLAPLPAALTRDSIHAVRAYYMVVPLTMIIATGADYCIRLLLLLRSRTGRTIGFGTLLVVYAISLVYFWDALFIHLPKHNSEYWDYGYKQIVETVSPIQKNYKKVIVQQSYAQPYIYFLFYQKYDPVKYQREVKWIPSENVYDVGKVERLDNIVFGPVDWSLNRGDSGVLIAGDIIRIPIEDSIDKELFEEIAEVKYLNGMTAFRVIGIK